MIVRLLVSRAGVDFAQTAGDLIEVDPAEARRLIAAGHAESLDRPVAAVTGPEEVAIRPPAKGRRVRE